MGSDAGKERDDQQLIEAARRGDDIAFAGLVQKYGATALRVVLRYVGDRDAAQDVYQEALIKAWSGLNGFQVGRPFRPWFLQIAVNHALTFLERDPRRRESRLCPDEKWSDDEDPSKRMLDEERNSRIRACLAGLGESDRAIVTLRDFDELEYEEIAQILDCSINTVASRLHRARKRLRPFLERDIMSDVEEADHESR